MQGELRDKQKGKNDPPCMKCVSSDQISFMKTSERSNNNRQKTEMLTFRLDVSVETDDSHNQCGQPEKPCY